MVLFDCAAMSLTVRLVPRHGDPHEELQPGLMERREVTVDTSSDDGGIVVGRGPLTGIVDRAVDEKAFRLSFDDTCFSQHQVLGSLMVSDDSNVYVNGLPWAEEEPHIYLSHGDVISLNGLRYEYKIHIEATGSTRKKRKSRSEDAISVSSTSSSPKPEEIEPLASLSNAETLSSPAVVVLEESASRISEEIQCSVCLDIQVHPRTLNPCGHSFCSHCLEQLDHCPQCRKQIVSHVPALQLDGLIAALVAVPNLLDEDDVGHYKERKAAYKQVSWDCEHVLYNIFRATRFLTVSLRKSSTPKARPSPLKASRTALRGANIAQAGRSASHTTRVFDTSMAPPFRHNPYARNRRVILPGGHHSQAVPALASRRRIGTPQQHAAHDASSFRIHANPTAAASGSTTGSRLRVGGSVADAICID